jgi:hypothetical protein
MRDVEKKFRYAKQGWPRKVMESEGSVFVTTGRSAYGVLSLVFLAVIVLAWAADFDGPAVRISRDYWRWVVPVAIPATIFTAWRLQRALIGSWYKPRYASENRQIGLAESWATGAIAAIVLAMFATGAFANVVNQVIGISYVATYKVTEKYIARGKHTCYGLTVTKVADSLDQFQICVAQSEQEKVNLGDTLQVSGRRSRYVNQLLNYTISR